MPSVPDLSLETGLAALKQKDYQTAIAHLEAVCQNQRSRTATARAQMGLVVAYDRIGEIERAIALCQTLTNSDKRGVKEWATQTLADFANRYPDAAFTPSDVDNTGFVVYDTPPPTSRQQHVSPVTTQTEVSSQGVSPALTSQQSPSESLTQNASRDKSDRVSTTQIPNPSAQWRYAGRAKRWQPLAVVSLIPFWLLQAGSAIALFWVVRFIIKFAMSATNDLLVKLPYLEPFQLFYSDPTQLILFALLLVVVFSPKLGDLLLQFYDRQPLSIEQLSNHSPEAVRVLQRFCRQRRWSHPALLLLPTSAPVALSYGNLPRTARIVVSQGLLDQLEDDEIAVIYAGQLGHIANWDFVVMSLVVLVAQFPYTIYWQVSRWGLDLDKKARHQNQDFSFKIISFGAFAAGAIACGAYFVWCLLTGTGLWLSQLRSYYSDRTVAEFTGNPNGLTRALLKIAIGIAANIQKQGQTSSLLESWDLLLSVGYRQAITIGSVYPHTDFESILAWDCANPYRYWLAINNTHAIIGDRLQRLTRIARQWQLEPELNLNRPPSIALNQNPKSFLLQIAPWLGIPVGFALAGLIWLLWQIFFMLELWNLKWIYDDGSFIAGCLFIGFSLGIFARINRFFPDIKPSTIQTDPNLAEFLANPNALPVDNQPVRLQGKLLGRPGCRNWLGQDLILHSATGLVKLHHLSPLGPVGNLLPIQLPRPSELVGRHLITSGWLRRGVTPWIDIDTLQTQGGKTTSSGHPVWSTLLGTATAIWGAYIMFRGS